MSARYSSRFARWDLTPNRLSELIREKQGRYLDLTVSNPTRFFAGPEWLPLPPPPYDPDPRGLRAAREAVGAYYARRGATVHPDQVFLTASTSEAYAWVFKLLCDPGDEVLVPRPSYPLFEFLAGMESVAAYPYPIDTADTGHWVAERTRAIVIVNPNNPTGKYARQPLIPGIPVIADEVFLDYWYEEARPSFAGRNEGLTFTLSGLSKVCGLPQMKLGWIVVSGEGWREAAEKLELIADTYLSVSSPVQQQAVKWLEQAEEIQRPIRERLSANWKTLEVKPEGGWTGVIPLGEGIDEEQFVIDLLQEDGVLVQPGYFFDFEGEARAVVSLLIHPDDFLEGLNVVKIRRNQYQRTGSRLPVRTTREVPSGETLS